MSTLAVYLISLSVNAAEWTISAVRDRTSSNASEMHQGSPRFPEEVLKLHILANDDMIAKRSGSSLRVLADYVFFAGLHMEADLRLGPNQS
jgi:hypothetical protein